MFPFTPSSPGILPNSLFTLFIKQANKLFSINRALQPPLD
jgi:hypothetical protein